MVVSDGTGLSLVVPFPSRLSLLTTIPTAPCPAVSRSLRITFGSLRSGPRRECRERCGTGREPGEKVMKGRDRSGQGW